ncbi:hypothetical protein YC2023_070998 [Brassica napus]
MRSSEISPASPLLAQLFSLPKNLCLEVFLFSAGLFERGGAESSNNSFRVGLCGLEMAALSGLDLVGLRSQASSASLRVLWWSTEYARGACSGLLCLPCSSILWRRVGGRDLFPCRASLGA